jgi:predicted nucleic acid-binding protein
VILIDTSVWIAHFRRRDPDLVRLLARGTVASCAVVRAELRLGSGIPAAAVSLLGRLPELPVPDAAAALAFLDRHENALAGTGVGFADLLVLACASGAGARLRTADARMRGAWLRLGLETG